MHWLTATSLKDHLGLRVLWQGESCWGELFMAGMVKQDGGNIWRVQFPVRYLTVITACLLQTHHDTSVRGYDRTLWRLQKNPSDRTQATSNCTKSTVILHELTLQDLAFGVLNLGSLKKLGDKWDATSRCSFISVFSMLPYASLLPELRQTSAAPRMIKHILKNT